MQDRQTRRVFFQSAGLGAALGVAALHSPRATAQALQSQETPAENPKLTLGLASYSLRKFSLEDALKMTQRVALPYICLKSMHLPLDASPDQIAIAVEQVKKAGITLYAGGVITMRDEEQVTQAFEYARAAGMTTIVGSPAPEILPLVSKSVAKYDIRVAIHNHGPGDKNFPTPESVYEQVKSFDPRLGLCIDIGHTLRIGADPYQSAERFADRLLDVHIKDVTAAAPEGSTLEIGRGVIDIPRFVRTLISIGYSGVVSFEYEKDADDPLPGLAESVGYVRGVLATV